MRVRSHGSRFPIVGRRTEVGELVALLARAVRGEGGMVVLEGEAGIGKTFLLEEALEEAEALGFRCLVGSAEELEQIGRAHV